jgi:hypothetical protein
MDLSSDRQVEDTQMVRFAKIHTNITEYHVYISIYQKVF